jgi:hypothetical protein
MFIDKIIDFFRIFAYRFKKNFGPKFFQPEFWCITQKLNGQKIFFFFLWASKQLYNTTLMFLKNKGPITIRWLEKFSTIVEVILELTSRT